MKIGLFGHYGTANLGDEAIIAAVIASVRRFSPDAEIVGISIDPQDTQARHGIRALPTLSARHPPPRVRAECDSASGDLPRDPRRALQELKSLMKRIPVLIPLLRAARAVLEVLRAVPVEAAFLGRCAGRLRRIDLVLVSGSGQISDHFGGFWNYPFTFLKWSLVARGLRRRLVFISLGAGPLHARASRLAMRACLSLASYRSFRDEASRRLIEEIGVRGENHVFPDLAFNLPVPSITTTRAETDRPVIGINPVPYYNPVYWQTVDEAIYNRYLRKIAAFCRWLIESGHRVLLFPTQIRSDVIPIADIRAMLQSEDPSLLEDLMTPSISGVEDLLSAMAGTEAIIASRFHGVLLSYLVSVPAIGISYHDKIDSLIDDMGQSRFRLPIDRFTLEELVDRFKTLRRRQDEIRSTLREKVAQRREAIDCQYARILR